MAALLDLYTDDGFLELTIEQMATQLACSKATLYGIAPSRRELDDVVVRLHFQRVDERLADILSSTDDPVDRLHAYLNGIGVEVRRVSDRFVADVARSASSPIADEWLAGVAEQVRTLVMAISDSEAGGHASFLAEMAVSVISDAAYGTFMSRSGLEHADVYEFLAESVIRAATWRCSTRGTPTSPQ